nr:DUF4381 domain-containing protein [uncultured Desulfuromonas sp.]
MNPAQLQLRDIHLPQQVSGWPPAPGWWLLLALLLILAAAALWWRHRHRCRSYRRIALRQLADLERRFAQNPEEVAVITELSRLLRHMAILHFPDNACAGLQGESWLVFLDQNFSDQPFATGSGRVFASGPYQRHKTPDDPTALFALCRRWFNQLPPVPPRRAP